MTKQEIDNLCQKQDERSRVPVIKALSERYNKLGIDFTIETNDNKYGVYDFKLTVKGETYYCELKERTCKSNSFDGDFFEREKLIEMYKISDKLLYFASFPKDNTILVYDLMKVIREGKYKKANIYTERRSVNKGADFVYKDFYNIDKKAASLKLTCN